LYLGKSFFKYDIDIIYKKVVIAETTVHDIIKVNITCLFKSLIISTFPKKKYEKTITIKNILIKLAIVPKRKVSAFEILYFSVSEKNKDLANNIANAENE